MLNIVNRLHQLFSTFTVFKSLAAHLNMEKNKLKTPTNKLIFYLLMHIEIAQHINGDNYGKKILIYLHNH